MYSLRDHSSHKIIATFETAEAAYEYACELDERHNGDGVLIVGTCRERLRECTGHDYEDLDEDDREDVRDILDLAEEYGWDTPLYQLGGGMAGPDEITKIEAAEHFFWSYGPWDLIEADDE